MKELTDKIKGVTENIERITSFLNAVNASGYTLEEVVYMVKNLPPKQPRIDIVGQNGNDGEHYEEEAHS